MSRPSAEAARRREALTVQCAAQREQLAATAAAINAQLQGVNRGLALLRGLRMSPAVLAGAAALALGLGSTRAMRLVGRGYLAFNTVQRLWRSLQRRELR